MSVSRKLLTLFVVGILLLLVVLLATAQSVGAVLYVPPAVSEFIAVPKGDAPTTVRVLMKGTYDLCGGKPKVSRTLDGSETIYSYTVYQTTINCNSGQPRKDWWFQEDLNLPFNWRNYTIYVNEAPFNFGVPEFSTKIDLVP